MDDKTNRDRKTVDHEKSIDTHSCINRQFNEYISNNCVHNLALVHNEKINCLDNNKNSKIIYQSSKLTEKKNVYYYK